METQKKFFIKNQKGLRVLFDRVRLVGMIEPLLFGLSSDHINVNEIVARVESGLNDDMSSGQLMDLLMETVAFKTVSHPDFSILAARIYARMMHRNTPSDLLEYANNIHSFKDIGERECRLLSEETYEVFRNHHKELQSFIDYDMDLMFDFFGLKTLEKSYLLKVNGRLAERPQQMLMRVAAGIHGSDIPKVRETYQLMSQKWFTHATPTLFNAGTPHPQMSSCFLLSMIDDSIEGIYETLKRCALISKSAGGIGVSINNIRAQGSYIRGTNGISNGIVPMIRVYNATSRYVDQGGGKRKGSFALYLEPWHADIMEFLDLKKNHGKEEMRARDLFYGLWTPDLFMRRVKADANWTLMCPAECPGLNDCYGEEFDKLYESYEAMGKGRKTVKARALWLDIIGVQIETGTPYILYKDACNRKSNQQNLGTIRCSNLCTEIVEYTSPDEVAVCNLGSLALPKFVKQDRSGYDFAKLVEVTRVLTRNLNLIIDKNFYPVPEARNSNFKHRPIGIGVQGLADTFAMLRMKYDSKEALELNNRIFESIYYGACAESVELARRDGPYQSYEGSPTSKGVLQFDMWGVKPTMYDWDGLKDRMRLFGIRNSLLVAPMPTASTSQILGNNETFEAFTSNIYTRRVLSGEFICVNKHLVIDLIKAGKWNHEMQQKIIAANGSVQLIEDIPEEIKGLYKTVWELPQKAVIDLAVGRGPFIDQSQSLNIFFPQPNKQQLNKMHFYGWESGLKTGMYYLRTQPATDAIKFTVDPNTVKEANMKASGLGKRDSPDNDMQTQPAKKVKLQTVSAEEYEEESCLNCGS
jgi:ribonucleoside-diphosphate reductase alpha subunit